MEIRRSIESERAEISRTHIEAFGKDKGQEIADLVNDLFDDETAKPIVSLVATDSEKMIGHILFSKVCIAEATKDITAQILAPLAVHPDFQNRGVGEKLINEGLEILKSSGVQLVFVLGHPGYYPRCGFKTAGVLGFEAPYPIPEEHADAWMVQGLKEEVIGSVKGRVQCSDVLSQPQHWRE